MLCWSIYCSSRCVLRIVRVRRKWRSTCTTQSSHTMRFPHELVPTLQNLGDQVQHNSVQKGVHCVTPLVLPNEKGFCVVLYSLALLKAWTDTVITSSGLLHGTAPICPVCLAADPGPRSSGHQACRSAAEGSLAAARVWCSAAADRPCL